MLYIYIRPNQGGRRFVSLQFISATTTKVVKKTKRSSSPAGVKKHAEAIRMSMFPGGKPPLPKEVAKIEREDWPGPPSPAALLPEISKSSFRERIKKAFHDPAALLPEISKSSFR